MKIRIKGNSVRFRLSKSEVDLLGKEGLLQETTNFGSNVFTYSVKSTLEQELNATFTSSGITLHVPTKLLNQWAGTQSQVGIVNKIDVGKNEILTLLLEKDFKCIDAPAGENQDDFFENPDKVC